MIGGFFRTPRALPTPELVAFGIQVIAIGDDTATIEWHTAVGTTGQIEYGTTSSYGSTSTLEPSFLYGPPGSGGHVQTITGLTPGTLYHFRVVGAAADARAYASSDQTFTTTAPAPVTYDEIVLAETTLVSFWKLAETSGVVIVDSGGTNHGSYINTPTLGVAGPITGDTDTAVTFASAVPENGVIDTATDFPTGSAARSVELWCRSVTLAEQGLFTYGQYGGGGTRTIFSVAIAADGTLLFVNDTDGGNFGSAGDLTDGAWHHVVVTYTGTTVRAYIDGAEASGSPFTLGAVCATNTNNRWLAWTGSAGLNGSLSHVSLYTGVMSAGTVTTHYTAGAPSLVVSGVTTRTITPTSATIVWSVSDYATGVLEYGLTAGYGSTRIPTETSFTYRDHVQDITGLAPSTTYHYKVSGANAAGATYDSGDNTFATAASSAPPIQAAGAGQAILNATALNGTATIPFGEYRETMTVPRTMTVNIASGSIINGQNTRASWFVIPAVAPDTIVNATGVVFQNAASGAFQTGSFEVRGARSRINGGRYTGGRYSGIRVFNTGTDVVIQFAEVDNNRGPGITTDASHRLQVLDCTIHHNDTALVGQATLENESGGFKAGVSNNMVFRRNLVYNNKGPGLWLDISCNNAIFDSNVIHHNGFQGIFFEISDGADIFSNVLYENGWNDARGWGYSCNLLVASSKNAKVHDNQVAWGPVGISFVTQQRSDRPIPSNVGNECWGNTVGASPGRTGIAEFDDWNDPNATVFYPPATTRTPPNVVVAANDSRLTLVPKFPEAGH